MLGMVFVDLLLKPEEHKQNQKFCLVTVWSSLDCYPHAVTYLGYSYYSPDLAL